MSSVDAVRSWQFASDEVYESVYFRVTVMVPRKKLLNSKVLGQLVSISYVLQLLYEFRSYSKYIVKIMAMQCVYLAKQ